MPTIVDFVVFVLVCRAGPFTPAVRLAGIIQYILFSLKTSTEEDEEPLWGMSEDEVPGAPPPVKLSTFFSRFSFPLAAYNNVVKGCR